MDKINKKVDFQLDEKLVNGTYYYTTGNFDEKSKALKLLNKLVDNGFADARVINTEELKNIQGTTSQQAAAPMPKSDKEFYTIQIKALSHPVPLSYFKKLNTSKIREVLCEDGFYRYTYEKVKGYEAAKLLLDVVTNFGYPDAFVVPYNKYERPKTNDYIF
jgi:hypothetical protein